MDDHEQNSLPLKWKAGPAPTESNRGKEVKKEALAKALLEKQEDSLQEFSAQEIQEWFSAKELAELSSESYICAGNKYFYALVSDAFQPASEKQVADTADWLAKRIVYSAWRILPADLRTKMIAKVDAEQEHMYSQDLSRVRWVELGHDEPKDGKDVTEKMKTIVDGMQGADCSCSHCRHRTARRGRLSCRRKDTETCSSSSPVFSLLFLTVLACTPAEGVPQAMSMDL